ncbi:MAG: hypothetical protein HY544_05820 [Candidatus Diapherotrites archaeon]|uniref:DUF3368 domain-containing protein n=1 Tax=Candidatus Iainarchaeum sp. TaxID=3101447 RepID=A0A8T3YPQ7_9ARCH|nr:hypothetical protein [Candidatus Diapherotrites archaeon]
MGPEVKAVADSGPIIHLREIGALKALGIFKIIIPPAVNEEIRGRPPKAAVNAGFDNNLAQILQNEFELALAESQCIALAKAQSIRLFLTDGLDARTTAKEMGLEPHGTVGILLKAYRKRVFSKKETIELVKKLKTHSTRYITSDITNYTVEEIMKT